ncbi:MAG TPA: RnfH family protein [Burkholderiaceae bacterium]
MAEESTIGVSIAWVSEGAVRVEPIRLAAGATIAQALAIAVRAGYLESPDPGAVAVFGSLRPPGYLLREGDRIEITAALQVDPKVARRRRADSRRGRGGQRGNAPARSSAD